jgi:hypothetical protein
MRTNFRNHPYGFYRTGNSVVYFDRRYRPIVRVSDRAAVVDPLEWIEHSDQEWFYDDSNAPRRNAETRRRLQDLMDAIPELAAEVRRRYLAERKARAIAPRRWAAERYEHHTAMPGL